MSTEQPGLFPQLQPARNGSGRKAQKLFIPKLLTEASKSTWLNDSIDESHAILCKWADLETSGKLAQKKERTLQGEFLADVMGQALGYVQFSDGLENWNLEAAFPVPGGEADAAIGRFAPGDRPPPRVLIELKGPQVNIDHDRFDGRSPVQQVWDYLNEVPACPWGIVCNYVSFRLYHRTKTTRTYEHFTLQELRKPDRFREFYCLFERGGFLPALAGQRPRCDDLLEKSQNQQQAVGDKLYALYHDQRISLIRHLRQPPHSLPIDQAIHVAQKLLDRIIFIAFCEDRRLLPKGIIDYAWNVSGLTEHENPRWQSFKALFKRVDAGDSRRYINAYNGELFKPNKVDEVDLDDQWTDLFKEIASYDFETEVNVDILGRLFERSITDLELLRQNPDAAPPDEKTKSPGRRKREGVFYTPTFITKYIVQQAIGPCLTERYAALAARLKLDLATPPGHRTGKKWAQFHRGRYEILRSLRVCDPACGSGAFLIEAFDYLEGQYEEVIDDLLALEAGSENEHHQTSPTILRENLFGVDLSPEAVEITKLALWIRTAELGKPLSNLSGNIKCGNSVVSDRDVHPNAFDWPAAFPQAFDQGGFDVVIGNPPYIRQEALSPFKAHWETQFAGVFSGTADIYLFFFAAGIGILRPGGRLGFISSNSFARAAFAENFRRYLATEINVEQFIDLGDTRVFVDAKDVYPAITILQKPKQRPLSPSTVRSLRLRRADDPAMIAELVQSRSMVLPVSRLDPQGWQFDDPSVLELRGRLLSSSATLAHYASGKFYRGLITGLNAAFSITTEQSAHFRNKCHACSEVLKPLVGGQHLRRWYAEDSNEWLILFPNGWTAAKSGASDEKRAWRWLENNYGPVAAHLERFAAKARKRLDKGQFWWELRPCDYYDAFDSPKIMYPDIARGCRFHMDPGGLFSSNTTYFLPIGDFFLLGVLNSKITWFSIAGISIPFGEREGQFRYRLFSQYMEKLPIPAAKKSERSGIAALAKKSSQLGEARYKLQSKIQKRLTQGFGEGLPGVPLGILNNKAQEWWTASLNELGAALKASFKLQDNPFKKPKTADEWEPYLADHRRQVEKLSRELADAEREINDRVYHLFHLTADEIKLLEREVEH